MALALLPAIVELLIVIVPPSLKIPPPYLVAVLFAMVVLLIVATPLLPIPPPENSAVYPLSVEFTTARVPPVLL